MLLGLEDRLETFQRAQTDSAECRTTVIDGLLANGLQNSVRDCAWPRNL